MTKAEFVRSQPTTVPAAEVIEKAKAIGLTITKEYVSNVRSVTKAAARKAGRPRADTMPSIHVAASPKAERTVESLFRATASEMGLARAAQIIDEMRDEVRRAIG